VIPSTAEFQFNAIGIREEYGIVPFRVFSVLARRIENTAGEALHITRERINVRPVLRVKGYPA
jgi:hypothetical protein